ncbi:MAG: DUF4380 domain-containing protein [Bacillota bacterium]
MQKLKALAILIPIFFLATSSHAAEIKQTTYKGWASTALTNSLIEVHVVPAIGGRVIQLKLGSFEYLWVNDHLAGKLPPPTGLGPNGEWLNYGGDKLWPAPQGWSGDHEWPGPPDAILDGSPHACTILTPTGPQAALELKSLPDPRSGIQFSRVIRVFDNAAHVSFYSTMKNIDNRPRQWAIWQVTQLNASAKNKLGYNPEIRSYSPINPASIFPRGYTETFGLVNNPSFKSDPKAGLVIANYKRLVGKIGMDNSAGWLATVDGTAGYAFVERFTYFPGKKYPDNTSATLWMNGVGQIVTGDKIAESKDDPIETPPLVESEILSPLAYLKPGETYSYQSDWYVTKIGGNYPILSCTDAGVTCEPLRATRADNKLHLTGRFGVFAPGKLSILFLDSASAPLTQQDLNLSASPLEPLTINSDIPFPAKSASVTLILRDSSGKILGELTKAKIH